MILVCAFLFAGCVDHSGKQIPPGSTVVSEPIVLTILHMNDHHSHLDARTITLQLATAKGKREAIRTELGGFPRITAAFKEMEAQAEHVITIHSGDAITGDLYYTLTEGRADAEMMNTVCFDVMAVGNHEFDHGDAGLKKFAEYLHDDPCRTALLSANVRFGPESPLAEASELIQPSVILERGGHEIGIIGLTVAGKTQNASRPDPGTHFIDEATAAQNEIDRLRAAGVDIIILATHIGYEADRALVEQLSGVDVVVGGDTHTLLGPEILQEYGMSPAGPYPTHGTDRDGNPVCIVQAWQYTAVAGELRVHFDEYGGVTSCTGTPWVLIGDEFSRPQATDVSLTPAESAAIQADIATGDVLRITVPDAAASDILAPYAKQKRELGDMVIGSAANNLCLRRVPGAKRDISRSSLGDLCNRNERVNAHGGDVQQLVAEAFLWQGREFFQAEISILNGGAVRADIPAGRITVQDVYTVLPFANTLVQLNITGDEIKAVLEDAIDAVINIGNVASGSYPYAGGLRWHLDLNQPKGARFTNLEIKDEDGLYRPIDLNRIYKVITISYLADGKDYYTTFKGIGSDRRVNVDLDHADALLQYVRSQETNGSRVTRLPIKAYSTQVFIDTSPSSSEGFDQYVLAPTDRF
ncbi:5'-nucleotidase C-terminal domain-containing protein [Desulfobulbus alkaliphilus]|nr:5'-nucleotidase C-terminal domain-containing protein [Desulfobulbus alkaliphilus]